MGFNSVFKGLNSLSIHTKFRQLVSHPFSYISTPCVVFMYCCQLLISRLTFNRCRVRPRLQSPCRCAACVCLCHSRVHTWCCFATPYHLLRLTASALLRCTREGQMIGIKLHLPCRPTPCPIDSLIYDWFRDLRVPMHLGLNWRALCAPYQFMGALFLTKPSGGPQTYTLNVLWPQEVSQIHMSDWSQSITFTNNVGWGFILCSTLPTLRTVLSSAGFWHEVLTTTLVLFSNVATWHTSRRTGSCLWVVLRVVDGSRLQNVDS
jgi:hypothetical protein